MARRPPEDPQKTRKPDLPRPSPDEDQPQLVPALVIAWYDADPARLGQTALLGPPARGFVLGRGEAPRDDPEPRLRFFPQRPGAPEATVPDSEPLSDPCLSRRQLRFDVEEGRVTVTNLGSCELLLNGQAVPAGVAHELRVGTTLHLSPSLVLLYTSRPAGLLRPLSYHEIRRDERFGGPDRLGLVGESPTMWRLRDQLAFFARFPNKHVLILGESGTGKERAAQGVHLLGQVKGELVSRNASTIPAALAAAELFGNKRDYPQAGMPERAGLIGAAHRSTLFLDEIGELPKSEQAQLLRVLDEGEYQRLGESTTQRAELRLVAATNRGADELKHDFLARFRLRLEMPGLEQRREDIPLLLRHLLQVQRGPELERFFAPTGPRVAAALTERLLRHRYRTHVRELDEVLWQALSESPGDRVLLTGGVAQRLRTTFAPQGEITDEQIAQALERSGGVAAKAARELGISRDALNRRLKKRKE